MPPSSWVSNRRSSLPRSFARSTSLRSHFVDSNWMRDDAGLLHVCEDVLRLSVDFDIADGRSNQAHLDPPGTLYPGGFSGRRFLSVIESQAAWGGN